MILKINVKNHTLTYSYKSVIILKHKSVESLPNHPSKINSLGRKSFRFLSLIYLQKKALHEHIKK